MPQTTFFLSKQVLFSRSGLDRTACFWTNQKCPLYISAKTKHNLKFHFAFVPLETKRMEQQLFASAERSFHANGERRGAGESTRGQANALTR